MRYAALTVALCALAMASAARGADGIQRDTPFRVPFLVDGKSAINRAEVVLDAAGKSVLRVWYVSGNDILRADYSLTRQPGPEPGPEPEPEPNPDPTPTPTALFGIVVEESSQRTPEQAIVLLSQKVRGLFDKTEFRVVDKDSASRDVASYIQRSAGKPLPLLYLVDPQGRIHYEGPLPATETAMIELVNRYLKTRTQPTGQCPGGICWP